MPLYYQEKVRFLERFIHQSYRNWFRLDPTNIVGVRVAGRPLDDPFGHNLKVVFHVIQKKPLSRLRQSERLPRVLPVRFSDGEQMLIPTSVHETGAFRFQFQPGEEIDNRTAHESGSLGPFLTDGSRAYLITNFHVAAMHLMLDNQFFFNVDNGDVTDDLFINYEPYPFINYEPYPLKFGAFNETVDLGLIDVGDAGTFINQLPDGNFIDKTILPPPALTPPFYTYCPQTHPNGYTINLLSENMPFQTGFNNVVIENAMMADQYSNNGDSGSPVIDSNFRIVGLLLGADGGRSYILPFSTINDYITKFYKPLQIL